jgi:His-Xaa-Ser system protein HxsD
MTDLISQERSSASDVSTQPLEMTWPRSTTPLEAIERALYALADQVSGVVAEFGSSWLVTLHPRSSSAPAERLQHRMRQEVTDQTLRVRIAERTDPIRNLVFALAFSRSGIAPGAAASDADQ